MQPYIGQIIAVGFNFAPLGWLTCSGQLLAISEYDVLFNLIGTTYGGDGQTTFALPNLQGRVAVGAGTGPNLSAYTPGQAGGAEGVTLTGLQVPVHNHTMGAASGAGSTNSPGPQAILGASNDAAYDTNSPGTAMAPGAILANAGGQGHPNIQPVLCINYIIATQGIYPSPN